ncbi:hypothetical protein BLX24_28965 [Arsenicibacter rosenii]|uniref:Dipeptidylpeptidase IV N-terminal domain-containing protein n=2 Tax=Arsenicibacter rosenii TaxID=1750698 RepID=A0A1S2VAG5_9BACT|nr:hypothetical protein BLX24_28965 [Arsenicibacter rosenii]
MATNGFLSQSAYYPGFGLSADVLGGDVARDGSKSTYIVSVDKGAGQYEFQTFLTQLVNEQVISATLINRQGRAGKFSPDGQQLAFVSLANNSLIIYDLSSGQERSVPVADLAFARDIVWSPDGKWLAYNTQTNDGSRLWKIATSGGQPVPLSPVLPVSTENAIRNTTLTWSPDGQLIGLSRVRTDNNGMSWRAVISFYAATGSGETRFFDTQPGWIDTNPQFSPDGKQLAFLSTRTSPAQFIYSLWIRDLTSGTIRRIELLPGLIPSNDYAPRWLGNDRILFMGTQQGKKGFFTVFI